MLPREARWRLLWLSSLLHSGASALAVGKAASLTQLKSLMTQPQSAASRAAVEEAIRLKLSPGEIQRRKADYAEHLQLMYKQKMNI